MQRLTAAAKEQGPISRYCLSLFELEALVGLLQLRHARENPSPLTDGALRQLGERNVTVKQFKEARHRGTQRNAAGAGNRKPNIHKGE